MSRFLKYIFLFPILIFSQQRETNSVYLGYVGDIEFNKELDNENFELCFDKDIYQYFNDSRGFEYAGEKLAIEKEFLKEYKSIYIDNESGLIRIRFVVNCKGQTDRFRLIGMDKNYNPKEFNKSISDQLLKITKSLKGWKGKQIQGNKINYYQYLIFKIENGQLKEILP